MDYDFDAVIDRRGTGSTKWDDVAQRFGSADVLPMWVADMDFRSPQPVIDAIKATAEQGIFGYATSTPSYYESVTSWMERRHGWEVKKEWIVLAPGVVPALYVLVRAFTEPGDEVIVQTPAYFPFFYAIERNGRVACQSPLLLREERWAMDFDDLQRQISRRTKMLILCSPHNPVGRVWQDDELSRLCHICAEHDLIVVADEIHHDLVLPGFRHLPFANVARDYSHRLIVCTSASKTFNLPGLHTSNIIIPDTKLRERFCTAMAASGCGAVTTFGLIATQAAYERGEEWLEQLLAYLAGNVEFAMSYAATRIPGLRITRPEGTYLLWLDFRNTTVLPMDLARFLCTRAMVGLNIGTMFRGREDGFARMNIGCPQATLEQGLERIEKALK